MAFKLPHSEEMLSDKNRFINEDEFKAEKLSVKIRPLKINTNIRDQSCIVTFPRGSYENRLTRSSVEEIMKIQWGDLYAHVIHFGNIDFSRKWIFHFDTQENCEIAVAKELFINSKGLCSLNDMPRAYLPFITSLNKPLKLGLEVCKKSLELCN